MGCVSGQPKNNELKVKNDPKNVVSTNGISPDQLQPPVQYQNLPHVLEQQAQAQNATNILHQGNQINRQLKSRIDASGANLAPNINPPSNVINNEIQNRPITVNDINVSGLNNVAQKAPSSNIMEIESHDYAPSGIVKRSGNRGIEIGEQLNTNDDDVVHDEGGANFTPSVRNINFHIQIS